MRLLSLSLFIAIPATASAAVDSFQKTVEPFLAKNCIACHNEKNHSGDVNFQQFNSLESMVKGRDNFEALVRRVRAGEMPPKGLPRPKPAEVEAVTRLVETEFARIDRNTKPDPGRVTAHRLNKTEYNNTVRDLLAVRFKPADDFPADDSGYGFDNIGDVLTLSPVLLDKYLAAAEKISKMAVGAAPNIRATAERFKNTSGPSRVPNPTQGVKYKFPVDAEYDIRTGLGGQRLDGKETVMVSVAVDGKEVKTIDLLPTQQRGRFTEVRVPISQGEHAIRVRLLPPTAEAAAIPSTNKGPRTGFVDYVELRGPYKQKTGAELDSYKKVFVCGHAPGQHQAACSRKVLAPLATHAYRRPVTEKELAKLQGFVDLATKQGDSFEQGIAVAIQAVLVSPQFLFRVERDPKPGAVSRITDLELASRLSYFLWSSMPDEELLRLAETNKLHVPAVLDAQVKRLIADPKSAALAENFAGQWLEIRSLDAVKPDAKKFPEWNADLKEAMRTETRLFFEAVMRDDRPISDFIDGKYTFVNEMLAKHYGIEGVTGPDFRRVELTTDQRSGVLTQGSVLTVSSYPSRTSVVLRGKYLLENILGAPPPPPPPDVPRLNEETVGVAKSLRQQMEQHRSDAVCASCHSRMDVLGFGLENYDAIGRWRTTDGKFPVDPAGSFPNGKAFSTPAEMKTLLHDNMPEFTRCFTQKFLTYALGRGVESFDRRTVQDIVRQTAAQDYRFQTLISAIIHSVPFQQRRAEAKRSEVKTEVSRK